MSHLLFCSEPFPRKHLSSFSLEIIQNKIKIYYKVEIKDFERHLKFETRLKHRLVPLKTVFSVMRFKPALN